MEDGTDRYHHSDVTAVPSAFRVRGEALPCLGPGVLPRLGRSNLLGANRMKNLRRRAFLLTFLLVLPVQMLASRLWSEPYPALYQPSFASSAKEDNVLVVEVPRVDAVFSDGRRASFSHIEVVGDVATSEMTIFNAGLQTSASRIDEVETVAWLHERLENLGGAAPTSARISWHRYEQPIAEEMPQAVETTHEVEVDFSVLDAG